MIKKIYSTFLLFIILSSISAQLSDLEQNLIDVFGVIGNEVRMKPVYSTHLICNVTNLYELTL